MLWVVTSCRLVLATTFLVSGFVKAVDPMGMCYKLNAYVEHWGGHLSDDSLILRAVSVSLSALEFVLGIYLLLGIRKRFTSVFVCVFMWLMTATTVYLYAFNPVPDCGCFGSAFTLTNGQTLAKNIVLLAASMVVMWRHRYVLRLISERNQWITSMYSWVYIILLNLYSIHYLPVVDFTDFKVGTDLRAAYYEPAADTPVMLMGFECATADGRSFTDSLLAERGEVFLLTLPDINTADDGCNDRINDIYDACCDSGLSFYALTSYGMDSVAISSWIDRTGAAYPILMADGDMLKAMVRSNPGLMMLKDAKIAGKWSRNELPDSEGREWKDGYKGWGAHLSLLKLVMWFILPLVLITLIDRVWIGTKFYKHHIFRKHLKLEENEKENCSR